MAEAASIHLNARVRGMKSSLFTSAEIEEMLQQGDLQRLIERLLDSPYRTELAEALTRYHGADAVEDAVSRNLVATFNALIRRAQGELQTLVSLFLQRWDLAAVKSLLRMRHHNLSPEQIGAGLMPGPSLTVPLLSELAAQDSMEALLTGLAGWNREMVRPLARLLPAYRDAHDLGLLEEALDRHYFVETARRLQNSEDEDLQMLRQYLRMEIDRINLRTVFGYLQGSKSGPLADERLLPQGLLPVTFLKDMAGSADVAAAMEKMASTLYESAVEELFPLLQTHRFAPLERFLERIVMHEIRRMARRDVFGLGVVMDFAWLKYNEAVNLRLIARGHAGHLPVGRVREELNLA
ncbi:MAG: V-type ATPase subunit [Candidatus Hydrogenedentes bacterium]|nr:V-type ATPase subunit [Candidatus Hydrogenedentota bacterium]